MAVAVFALVGFLIYRIVQTYDMAEVATALRSMPPRRFFMALGFAAASYLCLSGVEVLALRYADTSLAYPRILLTSFVSLSLGHNIGLSPLSSGAVRYRFYSRWGLDVGDVAKLLLFSGMTVSLGLATLGGGALILQPSLAGDVTGLGRGDAIAVGAGMLAFVTGYLILCALLRGAIRIRRKTLELPALRLALPQVAAGTINVACVAGCLHQAFLGIGQIDYVQAVLLHVIANVATVISHAPGGLGVTESVVLLLLPQANVLAALVVFRVAYFLVPLFIGASILAVTEAIWWRKK